jgi:hypothetical protein
MTTTISGDHNLPTPPPNPSPSTTNNAPRPSRREATARWRSQLRQTWKMAEAQAALGWAVIILLAAVVGTIYLAQASTLAETGRRVQRAQIELSNYKRENNQLEEKIAQAQALDRLQPEAQRLGFSQPNPEALLYLVITDYPTTQPAPAPEPTPLPEPIETVEEALFAFLRAQLATLQRGEVYE